MQADTTRVQYAKDVPVAPVSEIVELERELADATNVLANATGAFLEARSLHAEAADRYATLLARVEGARKEVGA